jgi:hypothetical protein
MDLKEARDLQIKQTPKMKKLKNLLRNYLSGVKEMLHLKSTKYAMFTKQ